MANSPYTRRPDAEPEPRPACVGMPPELFDTEDLSAAALVVCGRCKLRSWCLRTVDPARAAYTGTVGGVVWRNGYAVPLPGWEPPRELAGYMETARCRV